MTDTIPTTWEIKSLGEIVKIQSQQVESTDPKYQNLPNLGLANIESWSGALIDVQTAADSNQIGAKHHFNSGDVLYGKLRPNLAKVCFPKFEGICSTDIFPLVAQETLHAGFLFQYLLTESFTLRAVGISGGTGMPRIGRNDLLSLNIPIPPLVEQEKIADILTSVDDTIEHTQAQVAKLQDLKTATMNELLTRGIGHTEFRESELGLIPTTWEATKIDQVCKVRRGASPRPITDERWWGGSVGWTRISDVTSTRKYLTKTKDYLSPDGVAKSLEIPQGEVIMSICATIGRSVIVNAPICIHDGFVYFEDLDKEIDREFFYYLLSSLEDYFGSQRQTGTQGNLNTSIVGRKQIAVPPLVEQEKIANILTSLDDQIEAVESKLVQLESLKKSLMGDLLTGRVRVSVD